MRQRDRVWHAVEMFTAELTASGTLTHLHLAARCPGLTLP